jgi:aldehyde:ferredoxin oxidoreductase
MAAFLGKILHVDLTNRTFSVETPPESFYRRYLGGRGFIAYYLLKEVAAGADPLGPENVLVFAPSVVTGSLVPGTSRFSVGAKSPLTNGFGEGEAGGPWGPELKAAGFDAVVVKGASSTPVYLLIHDGQVEFHDASPIWGQDTGATQAYIRRQHDNPRIEVTGIGQAGENLVRIAAVMSKARHAIGRSGMGAVMGSKRLKAIAVRGTKRAEMAHPEAIKALRTYFAEHYKENADDNMLHQYGTSQYFLNINVAGLCPTRNFQDGVLQEAEKVGHQALHTQMIVKSDACPGCSVACKRVVTFQDGDKTIDPTFGGPEFESMTAFSAVSGNNDLYAMVKGNELCNRYGLDTIATGNVIAFAIECYERGFLTREHTGGLKLRWGDPDLMLELAVHHRSGRGDRAGSHRLGSLPLGTDEGWRAWSEHGTRLQPQAGADRKGRCLARAHVRGHRQWRPEGQCSSP